MNRIKKISLTTPGEILEEEFLKPNSLKYIEVAKSIDIPPSRLSEIIHGKRAISLDTAQRLARYLGTTPQFWLNLQNHYDLQRAEEGHKTKSIKKIIPLQRHKHKKLTRLLA